MLMLRHATALFRRHDIVFEFYARYWLLFTLLTRFICCRLPLLLTRDMIYAADAFRLFAFDALDFLLLPLRCRYAADMLTRAAAMPPGYDRHAAYVVTA